MLDVLKEDFIYQTPDGIKYFFTPDYCLHIGGIKLRDIRGSDLAYIDWIRKEEDRRHLSSLSFAIDFLSNFLETNPGVYDLRNTNPLKKMPQKTVKTIFDVYLEKVLRVPMSRDKWLESIYYLNSNSFTNIREYENIPMTEFLQMITIHNEYMERVDRANKK